MNDFEFNGYFWVRDAGESDKVSGAKTAKVLISNNPLLIKTYIMRQYGINVNFEI